MKYTTSKLLRQIIEIEQWRRTKLPFSDSPVGFELMIFLRLSNIEGIEPTLKQAILSTNYSEAAVRIHIRQLVKIGWCEVRASKIDKRCKVLRAKAPLVEATDDYIRFLVAEFGVKRYRLSNGGRGDKKP
jgi:hypothetical protein